MLEHPDANREGQRFVPIAIGAVILHTVIVDCGLRMLDLINPESEIKNPESQRSLNDGNFGKPVKWLRVRFPCYPQSGCGLRNWNTDY